MSLITPSIVRIVRYQAAFTMIAAGRNRYRWGLVGEGALRAYPAAEAKSDILQTMLVGQAVTETTGIFAFIISIILSLQIPLSACFNGPLSRMQG